MDITQKISRIEERVAILDLTIMLLDSAEEIRQSMRIKAGFDPSQPRIPVGDPNGGQWAEIDDGGVRYVPKPSPPPLSLRLSPQEVARNRRLNMMAPAGTPLSDMATDPITRLPRWYASGMTEQIGSATSDALTILTLGEARILGSTLKNWATQRYRSFSSNKRIRRALNAIEDFFGEPLKPGDIQTNRNGDIFIEKNARHFRMDIRNPGTIDGKIDRPHFHLKRKTASGKLKDLTKTHRNYFRKNAE